MDSTVLHYRSSRIQWALKHFIILCFTVKGISNLSTDHWVMCFFRQNWCCTVGINIYKWNIYISDLGKLVTGLHFQFSLEEKINMRSFWFLRVVCPFLCCFLKYFTHCEWYMLVYSQSTDIHTTTTPLPKWTHSPRMQCCCFVLQAASRWCSLCVPGRNNGKHNHSTTALGWWWTYVTCVVNKAVRYLRIWAAF